MSLYNSDVSASLVKKEDIEGGDDGNNLQSEMNLTFFNEVMNSDENFVHESDPHYSSSMWNSGVTSDMISLYAEKKDDEKVGESQEDNGRDISASNRLAGDFNLNSPDFHHEDVVNDDPDDKSDERTAR